MFRPKLLHTGDWHLGATLSGHSRLPEQYEITDEIVGIAIREEVSAFLIAGDFFDRRLSFRQGSQVAARIARSLQPLAEAGIPIVLMAGNHDPIEFFQMLREVVEITALRARGASERPLIVVQDPDIVRVGGMQILCLPYPAREILAAENGHDFSDEQDPILERNRAVTEKMRQLLQQMVDSPRFRPNVPAVLAAHFTMANAKLPGRSAMEPGGFQMDMIGDFVLPATAVPNRFVYGAFGHIHLPQDLPMPFPSRYCGCPLRLNTGEWNDEKSVTIVEILPDNTTDVRIVPLKQTPMERLELRLEDLDRLEGDRERYRNTYTKVKLYHDGLVPATTLRQRLVQLFPRHVGIELVGPDVMVRKSAEERLAEAIGAGSAAAQKGSMVGWNIDDHKGTIRLYLDEVLSDHPERERIVRRALHLTEEAERLFYGAPEEDAVLNEKAAAPEWATNLPDFVELRAVRDELEATGALPRWFRSRFPGITAERICATPDAEAMENAQREILESGALPDSFIQSFPLVAAELLQAPGNAEMDAEPVEVFA